VLAALADDFLFEREDCDCWPGGATVAPAAFPAGRMWWWELERDGFGCGNESLGTGV